MRQVRKTGIVRGTTKTTIVTTTRRAPLLPSLQQLLASLSLLSLLLQFKPLPFLLSNVGVSLVPVVEGAVSGQLLGGLYTPTTDVSHM